MAHKSHKGETRTGGPLSVVEVKASDMQSPKMMAIATEVYEIYYIHFYNSIEHLLTSILTS